MLVILLASSAFLAPPALRPVHNARQPAVTMALDPRVAVQSAATGAAAAYGALSRPAQIVLVGAVLATTIGVKNEMSKRAALISSGEACMLGDDDECETFDSTVAKAPAWKLKWAADKLAQTNTVAARLAGEPPEGFEWGIQK